MAGALVSTSAAATQAAGTSLGEVTAFAADNATYTLTAPTPRPASR